MTTSKISDRTQLTILLADPVELVDVAKVSKKLRKKLGLSVIEVLAERVDGD